MTTAALPGLGQYASQGATLDEPERRYRYRLWRLWGKSSTVLWIMLNPSTADEHVLDPTLRRVERFSRDLGYDGFEVANLFALRSPSPKSLYKTDKPIGAAPLGIDNDNAIVDLASAASLIVAGWGKEKIARARAIEVMRLLKGYHVCCLGKNADGSPRHPLYLPADTQLESFT